MFYKYNPNFGRKVIKITNEINVKTQKFEKIGKPTFNNKHLRFSEI